MNNKGVPTRLEQRAKKSLKDFRKACGQAEKLLDPLNRRIIALLVHGRPDPDTLDAADHLAQQLQGVIDAVDQLRGHFGAGRADSSQQCAERLVRGMAPRPVIGGTPSAASGPAATAAPAHSPTPEATPAPAAKRAPQALLRGSNRCLPVATVLELLSSQSKTGSLRISTEHENFTLDLVDGDIVHTATDRPPADQLLGNILVDRGAVTREAFDEFVQRIGQSTEPIGDALEREELTSVHELQAALEYQVQERFNRIFAAQEATYYFFEQSQTSHDDRVRMNVTQLLLESARSSDEEQRDEPEPAWGDSPGQPPEDPAGGWGTSPT